MWTEEQRRIYRREGEGYPSNLREAEWARLEPLIPEASPGGRPRKTDMRAAMNAVLYLLRTGCPWRYLPRDGFPPHSTVYNIFRKFQRDGVWEAIWAELHTALRKQIQVTRHCLGEGARATTFAVPLGPQDLGLKRGGLFGRGFGVVALRAAANALDGDGATDREMADGFALGDGEGHRRASSRAWRESRSKRIILPERSTGIWWRRISSRRYRGVNRRSSATSAMVKSRSGVDMRRGSPAGGCRGAATRERLEQAKVSRARRISEMRGADAEVVQLRA
jgi:putative transposase